MHEDNRLENKMTAIEKEAYNRLLDTDNIDWSDKIIKGDMPGDKVNINDDHVKKARLILPSLLELLIPVINKQPNHKAVVAVCGGSGVGKSEIASLLSYYLTELDFESYTLSGDNYPHRIPKYNDAERLRVFRQGGIQGLISQGEYSKEVASALKELQEKGQDANPEYINDYPWLSYYRAAGINGLKGYLGTNNEINFAEINNIISSFKNGTASIYLRRMGREEADLWYDAVDFSSKSVLIIEWTHSNNDNLQGVDIPILLNSTPEETLAHRKARNRDEATDSPFTSIVLDIEQKLLISQAVKAKIIVAKNGDFLSYNDFMRIMA